MAQTLVIFYSRSGYTKLIGNAIEIACHADVEHIKNGTRRGLIGYLRSGYEAMNKKMPDIKPVEKNLSQYRLIVVGTPVWAGNIASPVRTFITQYRDQLKDVAFFCTMGGSGADKVFEDMEQLCGKPPLATLAVTDDEIKPGSYQKKLDGFVNSLIKYRENGIMY